MDQVCSPVDSILALRDQGEEQRCEAAAEIHYQVKIPLFHFSGKANTSRKIKYFQASGAIEEAGIVAQDLV